MTFFSRNPFIFVGTSRRTVVRSTTSPSCPSFCEDRGWDARLRSESRQAPLRAPPPVRGGGIPRGGLPPTPGRAPSLARRSAHLARSKWGRLEEGRGPFGGRAWAIGGRPWGQAHFGSDGGGSSRAPGRGGIGVAPAAPLRALPDGGLFAASHQSPRPAFPVEFCETRHLTPEVRLRSLGKVPDMPSLPPSLPCFFVRTVYLLIPLFPPSVLLPRRISTAPCARSQVPYPSFR